VAQPDKISKLAKMLNDFKGIIRLMKNTKIPSTKHQIPNKFQ
jgi:hypothetical protein